MKTLPRIIAVIALSVFIAPRLHADAVATLSGVVKDAKGQPLQGAEIRIVGSDPNKVGKIHTDAHGRYSYPGLETGIYSVTLVVNGATKASIGNVKTQSGGVQTLNFELRSGAMAKPFTKGKHYVWVPSQTGTHLGQWMEVENDGKVMPSGMAERVNNQGNALVQRIQNQNPGPAAPIR
jgi:Carboxypeptidase regulatory-like domain